MNGVMKDKVVPNQPLYMKDNEGKSPQINLHTLASKLVRKNLKMQ